MENLLFSLDIGTRSVVGTILRPLDDERYEVLDLLQKEHKERAMIDGQIHDVLSVASVIRSVKETFEETFGPLTDVHVAAAGRALRTVTAYATKDVSREPLRTKEAVEHVELSAVQRAHELLAKQFERDPNDYYCVGYSVLRYEIDGQPISHLVDQSGTTATAHVIATFLPKVVIESLLSALERAGLRMKGLTLEPIAAIHVLIPPSMRRLNIALIDIGAGTSDIAITKNNTVIAYGMVPVAGDEITEVISSHYLLDFPVAERVKRQLTTDEPIVFEDILGFEQTLQREEVLEVIDSSIEQLATSITDQILTLNGDESPQAVMVIGGGSLTPTITERFVRLLQLPDQRVGIRSLDAIATVKWDESFDSSPALVTPVGIAIAAQQSPIEYTTVFLNDEPLRLFEVNPLTVGDALLAAQLSIAKLFGEQGESIRCTVNGKRQTIQGEPGEPSVIYKNGELATVQDPLNAGDSLTVQEGKKGARAKRTIRQLFPSVADRSVTVNGEQYVVTPRYVRNGKDAQPDELIQDGDVIESILVDTIESLFHQLSIKRPKTSEALRISLNDRPHYVKTSETVLFMNGHRVTWDTPFMDGCTIDTAIRNERTVAQLLLELEVPIQSEIVVEFNGERIELKRPLFEATINDETTTDERATVTSDDTIAIRTKSDEPFIFSDVFQVVDFQLPTEELVTYQLVQNGQPATFTTPIFSGDVLSIHFQPME